MPKTLQNLLSIIKYKRRVFTQLVINLEPPLIEDITTKMCSTQITTTSKKNLTIEATDNPTIAPTMRNIVVFDIPLDAQSYENDNGYEITLPENRKEEVAGHIYRYNV